MQHVAFWILAILCQPQADTALGETVRSLVAAHDGQVAVSIRNLQTGETFAIDADTPMPTASLIKVAVMVEAYRQAEAGKLDLDELLVLKEDDKAPGSGILTKHFSAGLRLSVRDAVRLMMAYSDNAATNLVLDKIGLEATGKAMEDLGFPETKIHAKVFRRETSIAPDRSAKYGLGSTTANESVGLLALLHAGELGGEVGAKEMLAHLRACEDTQKATRLLPRRAVVYHKGGSVSASRTLGAIIETSSGPVALCVLTDKNADTSWSDENAGDLLCSKIALATYEHYHREQSENTAPRTLAIGSTGRRVAAIQRTLNARLAPKVEIAVDGDFGPQTQQAVLEFQRQAELTATGEVDAQTLKALEPLVEMDPVASRNGSRDADAAPPDDLHGPPLVTAKSWLIADGESGEILWSEDADTPRDIASVTKIMTAFVVLSLAEEDPSVLDEVIAFTQRADETSGSTAGVQAGEKVSVGDLMYGLLLPSGNDASVALGEHFGARFQEQGGDGEGDTLDAFIAEMNRTAAKLGLKNTEYKNTHGLTEQGHVSSAADQLLLVRAAMELPSFRRYVSTRRRGATLTTPDGQSRDVVWRNTNLLLRIDGFDGVKTGTTTAAGACLVSTGVREGKRLYVIVLGSTSSDGRYVDSRNLYRWAWSQLQTAAIAD